MRMKISMVVSFIEITDLEAPSLLKLAMGSPTPDKVQAVLTTYQRSDHCLMGCRVDGKLVGILGAKIVSNMATIQHIAVLAAYRRQGIGRLLIEELLNRFAIGFLFAETDDDAVGFYEKCDFTCKFFVDIHGKRYSCQKIRLLAAYSHT